MQRLTAFSLALGFSVAAWAGIPKYEPVPPEVWNLKLEDSQGTGAIILELRIALNEEKFDYYYRIRILSEGGKDAISLLRLSEKVEDLWGRTITRDGKEVPFTYRKDLLTRTVIKKGDLKADEKIVIPPGITADCVVEFHWADPRPTGYQESINDKCGKAYNWRLALSYPIYREIFTFPKASNWHFSSGTLKGEVSEQKEIKKIVLTQVPAFLEIPYALDSARGIPSFTMYGYGWEQDLQTSDGGFWKSYGMHTLQPKFEKNIHHGSRYRTWAQTMIKDLPGSPHKAAEELLLRLNERIQNINILPHHEFALMDKKSASYKYNGYDLDEAVQRGMTTSWGISALFYRLLKDANLRIRILQVADRDRHFLKPSSRNTGEIAGTLIGVIEDGKGTLWLDPAMRFAPPGLIHPNYQGTMGIAFDTSTWDAVFVQVPIQPAPFNQKRYTYKLKLSEEENRFTLNTTFSGYPEYSERYRFMFQELHLQNQDLRRQFEDSNKSFIIDHAEVFHATDPRENVAWHVEGHQECEAGRRREVVPFPGIPWPLIPPGSWPPERKDLIVLPYCSVQLASTTFTIPKGFQLIPMESVTHSNPFGKVAWIIKTTDNPECSEVKLFFRVDILKSVAQATEYEALKEFVGWIQEGATRTLLLEKGN